MNLQYVSTTQGNGLWGGWTFSCGYPKLLCGPFIFVCYILGYRKAIFQPWNRYHQTCLLVWKLQGGEQPKDTQKGSGISDSKTSAVYPSGFSLLLLICSKAWQIIDTWSPLPCVLREHPCRLSMAKTPSDQLRGLFYGLWWWVAFRKIVREIAPELTCTGRLPWHRCVGTSLLRGTLEKCSRHFAGQR